MDPEVIIGSAGGAPPAVEVSVNTGATTGTGAVTPDIGAAGDATLPATEGSPAVVISTPTETISTPKVETSLLGAEPPVAQKPAEGEAKPETGEQNPAEGEAPVVTYEPFKLPNGLEVAPERMGAFTEVAAGMRLTQEQAQSLVEMHATELQAALQRQVQSEVDRQYNVFHDMRRGWRETVEKDPAIGGNRLQTTVNEVIALRNQYVNDAQHLRELSEAFNTTGIGDHPAFIRWMHNVYQGMKHSFSESDTPVTGGPVAQSTGGSRYGRRYQASKRG